MTLEWDEPDRALLELLRRLRDRGYRFITPTPRTHAIVMARDPNGDARSIEDVLGWSRPFRPGSIDSTLEALLDRAGVAEIIDDRLRATVRVSSLDNNLFLHSAYPTLTSDAVFFGPDSYRFARFLREQLANVTASSVVDIGAGSGVGAIIAATALPTASIALTDINPLAIRFSRINVAACGLQAELHLGDILADVAGPIEIAIANPPYIVDADRRAYRDGGGLYGSELSVRMTRHLLQRLLPGGRLLLYTGSAIVGGQDQFLKLSKDAADAANCSLQYSEIDPDVFAEELCQPAYTGVDRIAVVGAIFTRFGTQT